MGTVQTRSSRVSPWCAIGSQAETAEHSFRQHMLKARGCTFCTNKCAFAASEGRSTEVSCLEGHERGRESRECSIAGLVNNAALDRFLT